MEWCGERHTGSIRRTTTPLRGSDMTTTTRMPRPGGSRGVPSQRPDFSVAYAVVDEGEQFSGGGDLGDALAAAGFDPFAIGADLDGGFTLDRLHGGPADLR